jgi:XTP/dITP diphosphohydrolase
MSPELEAADKLPHTMSKQIVLASSNPGKYREISDLLYGLDLRIVPQSELGITDTVENGLTFVENALLKARHAAHHSGLPVIADDSGLEVDALNGAPGIYSSRFAGSGANDVQNLEKLLADLADVPEFLRSARFQCVMVYMSHEYDPTPIICEGTWEGNILFAPRGSNGFGYDPVFYVPTHVCSSAELPAEVKNLLSHRGQAIRKLLERLKNRKL